MSSSALSVVIPCYREHDIIESTLDTVQTFVAERFERYEIIVVTDGSPDDTPERVRHWGHTHPDIPLIHIAFRTNRGKGAAVKAGFLRAQYDLVLMVDADLTIAMTELDHFLPAMTQADLVIASRMASGSHFEEPIPLHRSLLTRLFQLLQLLIIGNFEFSDTQCGFKLFRREALLPLVRQLTIDRFAFDAELLFLARKCNLRVAILPVTIYRDKRNSNVRIVSDSVDMLFSLLRIRFHDLTGRYDTHHSS